MMYFKSDPGRNKNLLDMANGRRCLLTAVHNCRTTDGTTTVACHQNEGKGFGLKRPDFMSVWGCVNCHAWYDQSGAPRAEKRRAFDAAHIRQVQEWRHI